MSCEANEELRMKLNPTGLDHIVLRVVDMARMRGFYIDVLGCSVERELAPSGLLQLRAGEDLIDLVDVARPLGRMGGAAPGVGARNMDHFCLNFRPFEIAAVRAHLTAHGVEVADEGERNGAGGEGWSLYIRDPEGNTVELKAA